MDVSDRKQRKQSLSFNFIVIAIYTGVCIWQTKELICFLSLFFVYSHADYAYQ